MGKTKTAFKFPYKIKKLDELPEEYRGVAESLYEEDDDDKSLVFQGFDVSPLKTKIEEFKREKQTKQEELKELKEQMKRYAVLGDDFEPEKFTEMRTAWEEAQQNKTKKLVDEGNFDELFKQRSAEKDAAHAKRVAALEKTLTTTASERDQFKIKLDEHDIDGITNRVVTKVGSPKKNALPRLIDYGRQVWKRDKEGQLQPYHPGTSEIWYGEKSQPLTEEEYGQKLLEECNFFFEPGSGGGSKGGSEEEGVRERGNVKYIDRSDLRLMAKYAKEILAGTVVAQ